MVTEEEDVGAREVARDAGELYAVPLAEFVPTRTRLARAARSGKDRERARRLQAMRKPTVAAWLVNQVVRHHPETVARLRDLGVRMRHAQAALDAKALSELRGERDAALARLQEAAAAVAGEAGQPMTGATAEEVRETGVAALADAGAEEAAWSGTLTRALGYSGFGEVDVSDAVVRTGTGTVLRRLDGGAEEVQAAPSDHEAEPDVEEPDAEEPDAEEPDTEQPDTEEPEGDHGEEGALGRVLARLRRTAEELGEQADDLARRALDARQRLADREQRVTEAEEALEAARQRLERAETERDEAATELAGLEREEADLRAGHASALEEVAATERALGRDGVPRQ